MKKLMLLLAIVSPLLVSSQPCKEVVGYYAGWQWYDRNHLMNPQSVPYEKYSILTYAFFEPQSNGTLKISDPWGDKNQLLGPINWATAPAGYDTQYDFGNPDYHLPNQKLSDYAHQGGCELLVSVGGWTFSTHFPAIASDPLKRSTFAHDCNSIVEIYGLDGIDLDWEYPSNIIEKQNFTILLQQVRDSLDTLEIELNRELKLTIAAGASPTNISNVEWNSVKNIVDIINLMSYDFYGTWDPITNHNAPLYPSSINAQTGFSCSEAASNLLVAGVPSNQITLGLAWYGRSQMTVGPPDVYTAGTSMADMIHFGMDDGTPLYYNIQNSLSEFNYHWDSEAQVPFLTGTTTNSFVSFDDENSIEIKAQFINGQNLRGAIIWEISGDYIESTTTPGTIASTPLLDILNSTFCSGVTGCEETINEDSDGDGYTTCENDCDDNDPAVNPGAMENVFNNIDDDCDGEIDEGVVTGCMYVESSNYNPLANVDDGSCLFSSDPCQADLDGNGFINVADLLMFMAAFGSSCP